MKIYNLHIDYNHAESMQQRLHITQKHIIQNHLNPFNICNLRRIKLMAGIKDDFGISIGTARTQFPPTVVSLNFP